MAFRAVILSIILRLSCRLKTIPIYDIGKPNNLNSLFKTLIQFYSLNEKPHVQVLIHILMDNIQTLTS